MLTNKNFNFQDQTIIFDYAVMIFFLQKLFSENKKWTKKMSNFDFSNYFWLKNMYIFQRVL
jgi:hypothetical protein